MKLKIGKKLRTASLSSKFTGSYRKKCLGSFYIKLPVRWSSGNAYVSGAGGLRFKSRVRQIEHSVANGLPQLRHFLAVSCVARKHNDAVMGTATRHTPHRNQ